MTNEITTLPKELNEVAVSSGLDKANSHAASFAPFMIKCNELSSKITGLNEDSAIDVKIAREVRLALVKNRTASEKVKDQSKATLLAESNLIQSLFNVIKNKSLLLEQDFEKIERAAEIKEKARKEALKEDRIIKLAEFNLDLTVYNLAEMSEATFNDLLTSQLLLKQEREATAARVEAERLEKERKEAEERERIRQENERLKAEAEEKEKQLTAERAEAKRIADEKEAALQKERATAKAEADRIAKENADKIAEIERKNKAARDKAAAETARIIKEQKDAADKLAAELKAKKDAELKAAEAARIAAEKAAKAPVKEKLSVWVNSMIITGIGTDGMTHDQIQLANEIFSKFSAFKQWAIKQIEAL